MGILHADAPALHGRHTVDQPIVFAILRSLYSEPNQYVAVAKP